MMMIILTCIFLIQEPQVQQIGNDELIDMRANPDVQIIDVRTPTEWSFGVIEGSKQIDFYGSTFVEEINKLDKSKPVILYCAGGARSARAAEKFIETGFSEIYDLKEGFRGWKKSGFPVIARK